MIAWLTVIVAAATLGGNPQLAIQCPNDRAFEREASTMFLYPDQVEAYAWVGGDRVVIRRRICNTLRNVAAGRKVQPFKAGYALLVLAHEVEHTRGIESEHEANCRAATKVRRLARLLGYRWPKLAARWGWRHAEASPGVYSCNRKQAKEYR